MELSEIRGYDDRTASYANLILAVTRDGRVEVLKNRYGPRTVEALFPSSAEHGASIIFEQHVGCAMLVLDAKSDGSTALSELPGALPPTVTDTIMEVLQKTTHAQLSNPHQCRALANEVFLAIGGVASSRQDSRALAESIVDFLGDHLSMDARTAKSVVQAVIEAQR